MKRRARLRLANLDEFFQVPLGEWFCQSDLEPMIESLKAHFAEIASKSNYEPKTEQELFDYAVSVLPDTYVEILREARCRLFVEVLKKTAVHFANNDFRPQVREFLDSMDKFFDDWDAKRIGKATTGGRPKSAPLTGEEVAYYDQAYKLIKEAKRQNAVALQAPAFELLKEFQTLLDQLHSERPQALARKYLQFKFNLPSMDDDTLRTKLKTSRPKN